MQDEFEVDLQYYGLTRVFHHDIKRIKFTLKLDLDNKYFSCNVQIRSSYLQAIKFDDDEILVKKGQKRYVPYMPSQVLATLRKIHTAFAHYFNDYLVSLESSETFGFPVIDRLQKEFDRVDLTMTICLLPLPAAFLRAFAWATLYSLSIVVSHAFPFVEKIRFGSKVKFTDSEIADSQPYNLDARNKNFILKQSNDFLEIVSQHLFLTYISKLVNIGEVPEYLIPGVIKENFESRDALENTRFELYRAIKISTGSTEAVQSLPDCV